MQHGPQESAAPAAHRSAAIALGRTFACALAVFAGLWLTVTPPVGADRWEQVALGALAVAGALLGVLWPVAAAIVTAAVTGVAWLRGLTADPFLLTGIAVFAIAERSGSRRFPRWMLPAAAVLLLVSLGLSSEGLQDRFRGMLLSTAVLAAAWMLGVRTRRARLEAAARSRAEERLRLSRDVHDVLSHSLGTIGVRAGVAAHVPALGEAELRACLRGIEEDARASTAELKALLRRERTGIAGEPPSLPLGAVLADLARSAENAGLRVQTDVASGVDDLPVAVRTTVRRVVQEGVTNAVRHAHAASLRICVRVRDGIVAVEVRDDGRGCPREWARGTG